MKPEVVVDCECAIGEAPLWHPIERKLYWLDIPYGRIWRYDPNCGVHELCHESDPIGGFTIQADGALLLFMARGAVKTWCDGKMQTIIEEIPEDRDALFNDCIADPEGRVYAGMKAGKTQLGKIYRLDPDKSLYKLLDGFSEPNGMGFTPDLKHIYQTDTLKQKRYIFDYNQRTGEISNQRVFVKVPKEFGMPDGMTVDSEGFVWSANFGGGNIIRYSPDGKEDKRIELPVKKVASLTFGGESYTDLFITTSGGDDRGNEGPLAGSVFVVVPEVNGKSVFLSKVGL